MGESSASDSAKLEPMDVPPPPQYISHLTGKLEEYFTTKSTSEHHFDDVECSSISSHLTANGCLTWATIPRIYIVLRLINQVHTIEDFVRLGLNDLCLPFNNTSNIPSSIPLSVRQRFLETQQVVLTKSIIIERGLSDKKHVLFSKDEPFPYEELGRLGRGQSALVDQVRSPLSGSVFARKRFQRVRGIPRDTIRMFLNELRILKRIDHEHCVELVGSYTDPKFFGILISPVAESNLNDFMAVAEKQDERRSMLSRFFGCLAGAVMYLHSNRIRHRDIKPENILIYQAKVYLTDFGISLDWEHLSRSTTTEDSGKTPLYCAPEVASQFAKRNSSTDIWSLGCVFIEMLVIVRGFTREELRTAFYKNSETRVFYRNSTVAHEWLNGRLLDGITVSSKMISQVTCKMLSLDPECRPKADRVYDTLSSCSSNDSLNTATYCGECCQSIEANVSETHSDDDAWDQDLQESINTAYITESPSVTGQYVSLQQQPQQPPNYSEGPAGQVESHQSSGVAYNHNLAPSLNPVFGVTLDELFKRDGSPVPLIVYQCIQAVDLYGLKVEGIYRNPGTLSHIQALKALFNSYATQVDFRYPEAFQHDINSVAGLLKQFFRELPDPLLTKDFYTKFIDAARIDDDTMRRDSMHALINALPEPNYATLRQILLHLFRVQQSSDVNRMNTTNLGIFWAFCIMGPHIGPHMADAGLQGRVIITILDNVLQIFNEY